MDADGSYAGLTAAVLRQYEPTLATSKAAGDAYLSAVKTTTLT
jgi:hypothetical protein